jgi:hypothetical protein
MFCWKGKGYLTLMLSKVVINAVNFMLRIYPFIPVSYSMVCNAAFWVKTSSESSQEKKNLDTKLLVVVLVPAFGHICPAASPALAAAFSVPAKVSRALAIFPPAASGEVVADGDEVSL